MDNSPDHIAKIQKFLEYIVEGDFADIIVHEAVEALGNLDNEQTLELIEKYRQNKKEISEMVLETCELAQDQIKWNKETDHGKTENLDMTKLKFTTNDPAPPFNYKMEE